LDTAAQTYADTEHYGFIVAGKFYRGNKRGGGRYVASMLRDRSRALQLMQQAMLLNLKDPDKVARAQFHFHCANLLLNGGGYYEPWRLQSLTDLAQLPDYQDGYNWYRGNQPAAPADAEGNPVLYHVPASYEVAQND